MMNTAKLWAKESYCKRLKVGAILSKDGRILVTGYNGTISKQQNCCEEKIYICDSCNKHFKDRVEECDVCQNNSFKISQVTSDFVLHAEQNVITFSAKNGISTDKCTLYITHSPCKLCSKLIAQSGIERVVYGEEYRDNEGIEFLKRVGVTIEKFENS